MCLGIPGRVTRIDDPERNVATVEISGVERQVNVTCVATPGEPLNRLVGTWVLVHVGFAMSVIDEDEAAKTLDVLRQLGEVREELDRIRQSAVP